MKTITLTVALILATLGSVAHASFYPPDYVYDEHCGNDGPVKVCVYNRYSNPFVRVTYNGYLMAQSWGKIGAWVGVNGRWGQFPMTNQNYTEYVKINYCRNVQLCYHNTTMQRTSAQYGYCPNADASGPMTFDWYREGPPQQERDLVGTSYTNPNGWDFEIAVYDYQGRWDNAFGHNHRIHIPARD